MLTDWVLASLHHLAVFALAAALAAELTLLTRDIDARGIGAWRASIWRLACWRGSW